MAYHSTHGHSPRLRGGPSRTYKIWAGMLSRCNIPSASRYENYGGRGIKVCAEWHKFESFLADMGEAPDGCSIERIDANGNYEKSNCRWATVAEQARNTTRNRNLTLNGRTQCMTDWAAELGVTPSCIHGRLFRKGMSVEDALTKPFKKSGVKGAKR